MANTKKKSTSKKVDKKLDELLKDKKNLDNTTEIKKITNKDKKTTTAKKKTTTKNAEPKKTTVSSVKKTTTKKSTSKKTTAKKTTTTRKKKDKFLIVDEVNNLDSSKSMSESTLKLNELSKQIRDLYEKVEEKKEPITIENLYVQDSEDDERIDKAYIILNRITIILFIIFMILFIAFIAFVVYICTY